MKIVVELEVSENTRVETFSLEDLGYSKEDWNELNDDEKNEVIVFEVQDISDQPYWTCDSFEEYPEHE